MNNVAGIPPQVIMDMLTLITGDADHSQPNIVHCSGGVVSYVQEPTDVNVCKPADPAKYPNWECVYDWGGYSHAYCAQQNVNPNESFVYCECPSVPQSNGLRIYNYIPYKGSRYLCPGCKNNHNKGIPCPVCGEIHE